MARKKKRLTKLERLLQDIQQTESDLKSVSATGVLKGLLDKRLQSLYETLTYYTENPNIGKEEIK